MNILLIAKDGTRMIGPDEYRQLFKRHAPAPAVKPAQDIPEIKRRFEICKGCKHGRDDGHNCALHQGCCFGRFRSDLRNKCPAGRWEDICGRAKTTR